MLNFSHQRKSEEQEPKGSFENSINTHLKLNLGMVIGIFKKLKFQENSIEEKFQEFQRENNRIQKVFSNIVLFLGYISALLYILFAFYHKEIILICLISNFISICFIIISNSKLITKRSYLIIEHLNVFLFTISFCIKCLVVCLVYNIVDNDNELCIMRFISICSVFTNLLIFLKFENNIFVSLFYFAVYFLMVLNFNIKLNNHHFYLFEGFMNLLLTLIFFALRKVCDYSLRKIFSEKYKFENFYKYTINYTPGLNNFYVNYDNDFKQYNYIDPNFENFLIAIDKNFKIFNSENETNKNKSNSYNVENNDSSAYVINNKNFMEGQINNEKKNLFGSIQNKSSNKNLMKIKKLEQQKIANSKIKINDNNSSSGVEIDKILNSSNSYLNENLDSNFISLNDFTKHLFILTDKCSINSGTDFVYLDQNVKKLFNLNNLNNLNENNSFNFNENKNNIISLYSVLQIIIKIELADIKFKDGKRNFTQDSNNFIKIGIFNFKNEHIKKYFEVHYRRNLNKNTLNSNNFYNNFNYDLLFYDVSELILSKKSIYEEQIIQQKLFAKIAHEFKTPIISVIGLIDSIKESIQISVVSKNKEKRSLNDNSNLLDESLSDKENKIPNSNKDRKKLALKMNNQYMNKIPTKNEIMKKFEDKIKIKINDRFSDKKEVNNKMIQNNKLIFIIENLSRYVIFLIGDIIHYSNIKDISQIKINTNEIFVREIAMFIFEILKCLLKCNSDKDKSIEAELILDEALSEISFQSDEIRLKQILLNIISNAVKFTKYGKIQLIFKLNPELNEINIIISDSGIGIKDEDKHFLFKDFVMLDSGSYQNPQGSGLGLSICKSLAYKLNLKLNFDSEFGKGSSFCVGVPLEIRKETSKRISGTAHFENQIIQKEEHQKSKPLTAKTTCRVFELEECKSTQQQIESSNSCITKNNKLKITQDVTRPSIYDNSEVMTEEPQKYGKKFYTVYSKHENTNSFSPVISNDFDSYIETKRIDSKVIYLNSNNDNKLKTPVKETDNLSIRYQEKQGKNFTLSENKEKIQESSNTIFTSDINNLHIITSPTNKPNRRKDSLVVHQNFQLYRKNSQKNILNSKGTVIRITNEEIFFNSNSKNNRSFNLDDSFHPHRGSPLAIYKKVARFGDRLKARKILVIDDNQIISDSIKSMIESIIREFKLDFEVIQGSDGVDILKAVVDDQKEGNLIECVLTDENMEYINGSNAIRILRDWQKSNKIKNIKLFSVTAQEDTESTQAILNSGADNILTKPLSRSILVNCFRDLKFIL